MTQLSLPDGRTLRDEGLALVEAHAGDFLPVMRELARSIDQRRGMVSTDELRAVAEDIGLVPHSPHAWGAIFIERGWVVVGRKRSAYTSNHYRVISVWSWRPGGA